MPKLLQIDTCLNDGSTGRITEGIARVAMASGWDCYIMHSARYATPPSVMKSYQIGTKFSEYIHYIVGLFFDNHGLCSTRWTQRAIREIKKIRPDVIQLHCIHGYYLNYKVLFEFMNTSNIPVVWTFHDCWAFTGHCTFFDSIDCNQWKSNCSKCRLHSGYPKSFIDRSRSNYDLKKRLFTSNKNLTLVAVSNWLGVLVSQSFFRKNHCRVIYNGIDTSIFKPDSNDGLRARYQSGGRFVIIGVASPWSARKGLSDFERLSKILGSHYQIILVGLNDRQLSKLSKDIIGIKRTSNANELAELYSTADVFVNPTYADNFPTTNIEALACGTPVITYRTGGSPEAIDEKTGIVVARGDIQGLVNAVKRLENSPLSSDDCRERAIQLFDRKSRYREYINLYNELIKRYNKTLLSGEILP